VKRPLISVIIFCISNFAIAQWSGTNPIYFNSGKVGIGTTTPGKALTINSDIDTHLRISKSAYPNNFDFGITSHNADIGYSTGTTTNANIRFLTNGSPKMYLRHDGNLGIGTIDPKEKLSVIGQNVSFYSQTSYNQLQLGRSVNESVKLNVGDNHMFLDYNQDSDANTSHILHIRNLANGTSSDNDIRFSTGGAERITIKSGGNIGIGTIDPKEKLSVNGTILSKKVRVSIAPGDWSDYVFASGYNLQSLIEVETFIKANKHLPDVPSAKEVVANGLDLGDMDATLLKKVEELTLYLIQENKDKEALKKENKELRSTLDEVLARLKKLENK